MENRYGSFSYWTRPLKGSIVSRTDAATFACLFHNNKVQRFKWKLSCSALPGFNSLEDQPLHMKLKSWLEGHASLPLQRFSIFGPKVWGLQRGARHCARDERKLCFRFLDWRLLLTQNSRKIVGRLFARDPVATSNLAELFPLAWEPAWPLQY